MRPLSTLEHTVLGLCWLRAPCTTYTIMRELESSASSFHRSRAGAVYSVMKRLQKFSLVSADEVGKLTVTEDGVKALRQWLTPPIPMADVAHSADLIRLRMFFLESLTHEHRLEFIDSAVDGLQGFLRQCEDLVAKNEEIGDYFGVLATLSTILETRARLHWLAIARRFVEAPIERGQWAVVALAALNESDAADATHP